MIIDGIEITSREQLEEVIKDMSEENKLHFRLLAESIGI